MQATVEMLHAVGRFVVEFEMDLDPLPDPEGSGDWHLSTPAVGVLFAAGLFGELEVTTVCELGELSPELVVQLHRDLDREGLVATTTTSSGDLQFTITDAGRRALDESERILRKHAPALVTAFDDLPPRMASSTSSVRSHSHPRTSCSRGGRLPHLYRFFNLMDQSVHDIVGGVPTPRRDR